MRPFDSGTFSQVRKMKAGEWDSDKEALCALQTWTSDELFDLAQYKKHSFRVTFLNVT